jgi:hypothetical protein
MLSQHCELRTSRARHAHMHDVSASVGTLKRPHRPPSVRHPDNDVCKKRLPMSGVCTAFGSPTCNSAALRSSPLLVSPDVTPRPILIPTSSANRIDEIHLFSRSFRPSTCLILRCLLMLSSVIPPGPFATSVCCKQFPSVRPQLPTNIRTNTLERSRPFISQHGPPNIVRVSRFSTPRDARSWGKAASFRRLSSISNSFVLKICL